MGRRLTVFICGPYRATASRNVLQHVRAAERAAIDVWLAGHVALCPHKNTAHFEGLLPDGAWLEGAQRLLGLCDAILLIDGWEHSAGCRAEAELAAEAGLALYYSPFDLPFTAW